MNPKQNVFEDGAVAYGTMSNETVYSIVETIRKGVSFSRFSKIFQHFPFTSPDWSWFLGISERTMHRYQKEKRTFDKLQSEKIINIFLLYKRGIEIFGSGENFNKWLDAPNTALGGEIPKKLLDNHFGITFLNDALTRMEHGITS